MGLSAARKTRWISATGEGSSTSDGRVTPKEKLVKGVQMATQTKTTAVAEAKITAEVNVDLAGTVAAPGKKTATPV